MVQIYSSAPWPNQMLSEDDFVPPAVHNSPANQIHLYLETSGVEKLCCSFFSMVKIRPSFLGKSPPWLAFLDDIPCVMFLWRGICFEILRKKSRCFIVAFHGQGVVDVIFSRQAPKI